MHTRVVVLGAGFGGLELTTILSDAFGDGIDIVAHRQGRCVRLRLLQARRDVRPAAAAGRPAPVPRHRQAGRAVRADDRALDRSRGEARRDRRRNVRRGHPDRRARRRPRSRRHARPRRRRPRVLLGRGRVRAARHAPAVRARSGDRRRLRQVVQVPAGAERDGAAAPRLPDRTRTPRRDGDHAGDAVRHADPAVARHVPRDPRRVRRARHPVREGQPGASRSTRRARWRC